MGAGLSAALGKDSLVEELRNKLDKLLNSMGSGEFQEESLDLANCYVGDEGLRLGSRNVRLNFSLTSLDLSSNNITSKGVAYLLDSLQYNSSIISLSLANNPGIGDDGCRALGSYLSTNPPLQELSLFQCGITDDGVEALVNGLLYNTNLAVLRLDMNQLSDESLEMLLDLVNRCENKTIGHVTLCGNPGPFDQGTLATFRGVTAEARDNFVARREADAAEKQRLMEHQRQLQLQAQQEEAERAAAEEAADAEAAAAAEQQRQEDELLRKQEQSAGMSSQRSRHGAVSREERAAREEELRKKVIDQSYQWREKLSGFGTLVREWRDGFTVMQTKPGDAPGAVPSVIPEPPRRLKACWCDPHDVSAPYAKTLHYHCKYESQGRTGLEEGEVGKYKGCRATGHCCATVGFFAKPLPDTSAAHFFASAHPAATL